MKAFVVVRCAARQLAAENSSKTVVADLEAKVASLEKEKAELETRLARSAEENATAASHLRGGNKDWVGKAAGRTA